MQPSFFRFSENNNSTIKIPDRMAKESNEVGQGKVNVFETFLSKQSYS